MSWLRRLFASGPALAPETATALEAYRRLPPVDPATDVRRVRFVVVDVETSGLNPWRDRLLAIGAVGVAELVLRLDDAFHALVRQERPSPHANIVVHGIDGTAQTSAPHAADSLLGFLRFAGKAPLVGFHAEFDRVVIERAMREALDLAPANPWLDLAQLAPSLVPEHGAAGSLDEWMAAFGIENYRRHDALADAFATAQLLQIVLARALASRHTRLADLIDAAAAQRWITRR